MSKQIYIDSDGNEVQVSGTVNSADMLPLEAGSSTMTSEAINAKMDKAITGQDLTSLLNTGWANAQASDTSFVKKIGSIIYLHLSVYNSVGVTNRKTILTLPNDYKPNKAVRFVCAAAKTHNSYVDISVTGFIGSDGNVIVGDNLDSGNNTKDFFIDVMYIKE